MKKLGLFIVLKFVVLLFSPIFCNEKFFNGAKIPKPYILTCTEAFLINIDQEWFPKSMHGMMEYSASLVNLPDLPSWMLSRPYNSSNSFLYGSPEEPGIIHIEIIAMNKDTYETASAVLELNIQPREKIYTHEVELKFLNLNVDDMFRNNRLSRLVEIFRSTLWKEQPDIYVTKVVSSLDAGGRLPLNPNTKEGVVVRIGAAGPFSRDLDDLDREVRPLRHRSPCPRDYKRTSVEHQFRGRSFVTDWCSFRLVSASTVEGRSDHSQYPPNPVDAWLPLSDLPPPRDLFWDFVVTVLVPTCFVVAVSIGLAFFRARPPTGTGTRPAEGVNPPTQAEEPEVAEQGANTPGSTLTRNHTPRPASRTGTLRGVVQPPPYPANNVANNTFVQ